MVESKGRGSKAAAAGKAVATVVAPELAVPAEVVSQLVEKALRKRREGSGPARVVPDASTGPHGASVVVLPTPPAFVLRKAKVFKRQGVTFVQPARGLTAKDVAIGTVVVVVGGVAYAAYKSGVFAALGPSYAPLNTQTGLLQVLTAPWKLVGL